MIQLFHSFVFNWSTLLFGLACRAESGLFLTKSFQLKGKLFQPGLKKKKTMASPIHHRKLQCLFVCGQKTGKL